MRLTYFNKQNKITSLLLLCIAYIMALSITLAWHTPTTSAAPVTGWNAGRIIEDWMMTASNSMSPSQIQTFLNSKVSYCDTWGTQPSEFGGGTRRQWAEARGYAAPYTCLKDYTENGKSASQIIYDVGQEFTINPQVLVVLLQKEQSLVTDTWPLPTQYKTATGYGCPDTAPCASQYFGLTNQLRWAARMFRAIMNDSPTWYTPYEVGENYIRYNPTASCGGTVVNIQNRSTQALYNYTPYQPNQGALAAGWGTAYCGAYGNRNFFLYFNEWFNFTSVLQSGITMTNVTMPDYTPVKGQEITYKFKLTNTLSIPINLNNVGVVGRLGSPTAGQNRDFGWQGAVTLGAGETREFTATTVVQDVGSLYVWPAINYQGFYVQYSPWGAALTARKPNISVVSPLTSSTQNPVAGQTVTFNATIRNNEDVPIKLEAMGVPIRFYDTWSYDTAWTTDTLAAGANKVISGSVVFDKPGPYKAWLSMVLVNEFVTLSPTSSYNVVAPYPNFALTYVEPLPRQTPAVGENISVKFKLKNTLPVPITISNVGVVGRHTGAGSNLNYDLGWTNAETFAPGEEKSFTTFNRTIERLEPFNMWVSLFYNGSFIHYSPYGLTVTPHLPNLSLSSPLTVNNGTNFSVGQTVPVTSTLKNNEPYPITISATGMPIRFSGTQNYDTGWVGPITLAASGQSGDTIPLNGNVKFDKPGTYTLWTSAFQNNTFRTIGNPRTIDL